MGIEDIELLFGNAHTVSTTSTTRSLLTGCKMRIAGEYCGKAETAEVHQTEAGHVYQEEE